MATYLNGVKNIYNGNVDLLTDTIKMVLVKGTYTPSQTTDETYADILAHVSTGTGITARGQAIDNKTITVDTGNLRTIFDADDEVFATITTTDVRWIVLYKDTGTDGTSYLLSWYDLGQQSVTGVSLEGIVAATGLIASIVN